MKGHRLPGLVVGTILAVTLGCATSPLPPSESTVSMLRSYRAQLEERVASGHVTRAQARDLYYTRLRETSPPLPELDVLLEFRRQLAAQVESRALTPEEADARLTARESDMLARWAEMAAQGARQRREIEQLRKEQERGLQQQQQPIGGRPFP